MRLVTTLLFLFGGLLPLFLPAQSGIVKEKNDAFTFGEELVYKVRYSLYVNIPVGEVKFKIKDEPGEFLGEKCYNIVSKGRTYGFYDPFFKVRDHYETYLSVENELPLFFIRIINEGSFHFQDHYVFFHDRKKARNREGEHFKIPPGTQDVLSVLYYTRTFDFKNAKIGDSLMLHTFIDDTAYYVGLRYLGKEMIRTKFGEFRCLKIKPILVVDRIFESEDDMTLWVSDDENKIPLRIESGISVGKVRADLVEFEGLRHEFLVKSR